MRPLIDVEQAVSPPADRSKPGARGDDRRPAERTRHCLAPALEPRRRRAGVQAAFSRAVLRAILQNVNEGVTNGAWTGQCARMVTVAPNTTVPAEGTVHGARHANGKPPNPAGERVRAVRFDQQ